MRLCEFLNMFSAFNTLSVKNRRHLNKQPEKEMGEHQRTNIRRLQRLLNHPVPEIRLDLNRLINLRPKMTTNRDPSGLQFLIPQRSSVSRGSSRRIALFEIIVVKAIFGVIDDGGASFSGANGRCLCLLWNDGLQ